MAGRRTKPEVNRARYHSSRVAQARTPKATLWAFCHWLVAEAWHAGPDQMDRVTQIVKTLIDELIQARKGSRQ